MDNEEIKFTCEVCGKEFEPTPDAMVEWHLEQEARPEDEAKDIGLTREELETMNEWDLKAMKLTPETRDALLAGKVVKFGGCICLPCQDEMLEEQENAPEN